MKHSPIVTLIFRQPQSGGYYSIERYFRELWKHFYHTTGIHIRQLTVDYISKGFWPRVAILFQLWRLKSRVYHITGDIHFAALALPGRRTVLTIHDCGFLRRRKGLARKILYYFWLKWPVQHCQIVTAVSDATKQDIIGHTGCAAEKIRVIPSVIPSNFQPKPKPFPQDKPRILHVGSASNKNLKRHIGALRDIPCTLHIIARLHREELDLLEQYKLDYQFANNLSDTEILQAFEQCDLLLFASTLEGFGMPILEAQAVGRPVVTSNCSSMPDTAGAGACLVDPFDEQSIREGILKVIQDAPYREMLIQRGFENVRRFQSETVAGQYLNLYREILQQA